MKRRRRIEPLPAEVRPSPRAMASDIAAALDDTPTLRCGECGRELEPGESCHHDRHVTRDDFAAELRDELLDAFPADALVVVESPAVVERRALVSEARRLAMGLRDGAHAYGHEQYDPDAIAWVLDRLANRLDDVDTFAPTPPATPAPASSPAGAGLSPCAPYESWAGRLLTDWCETCGHSLGMHERDTTCTACEAVRRGS